MEQPAEEGEPPLFEGETGPHVGVNAVGLWFRQAGPSRLLEGAGGPKKHDTHLQAAKKTSVSFRPFSSYVQKHKIFGFSEDLVLLLVYRTDPSPASRLFMPSTGWLIL